MSALAHPKPIEHPAAKPKPKLVKRIRALHQGRTRMQIVAKMRQSAWAWEELRCDVPRVCGDGCKIGIVESVYYHSRGSCDYTERGQHKGEKAKLGSWKQLTQPMLPEDFAKELGFSVQQCREALAELVEAGFVLRNEDGKMCLDPEAIREARNAWDAKRKETARETVGSVFRESRKGEGKENSGDSTDSYEESREGGTSEEPDAPMVIEPGATVKRGLARFESGLSTPITIAPIVRGLFTTYKLTPCSPASISGPQVVSMAVPGGAQAGDPCLPFHEDAFLAELGEMSVCLVPDDAILDKIASELRTAPRTFFLHLVREEVERHRRQGTTFRPILLVSIAKQAQAKWDKAPTSVRDRFLPAQPAMNGGDNSVAHANDLRLARRILAEPASYDASEIEWAAEVLK